MDNSYQFGKIFEGKIDIKDADYYANLFGEGSSALTDLIKYCIVNNIKTFASCKGHPEDKNILEKNIENGYLAFRIDDSDIDFAYFLASLPYLIPNIKAIVDFSSFSNKKSISIEVPARRDGMSDRYFNKMIDRFIEYKKLLANGGNFVVNANVKKIVDYAFLKPSTTMFYITDSNFFKVESVNGVFTHHVKKCSKADVTNKLHSAFCDLFNIPKNVDELIDKNK